MSRIVLNRVHSSSCLAGFLFDDSFESSSRLSHAISSRFSRLRLPVSTVPGSSRCWSSVPLGRSCAGSCLSLDTRPSAPPFRESRRLPVSRVVAARDAASNGSVCTVCCISLAPLALACPVASMLHTAGSPVLDFREYLFPVTSFASPRSIGLPKVTALSPGVSRPSVPSGSRSLCATMFVFRAFVFSRCADCRVALVRDSYRSNTVFYVPLAHCYLRGR